MIFLKQHLVRFETLSDIPFLNHSSQQWRGNHVFENQYIFILLKKFYQSLPLKDSMSQKLQAWEEWIHFENLSNGDCYWQKVEIAISGVILLAGTRSRPNIGRANCVPQLPPLRIYVNTTYQRYILWGSGHFTSTCFLLDEDTLWQPTRMGRTFGDKKNGLVIADCLAKDR